MRNKTEIMCTLGRRLQDETLNQTVVVAEALVEVLLDIRNQLENYNKPIVLNTIPDIDKIKKYVQDYL